MKRWKTELEDVTWGYNDALEDDPFTDLDSGWK